MSRYIYLSCFLLISVLTIGCGQSTSPDSTTSIYPLKEGYFWIYQVSTFDSKNSLQWDYRDTMKVGKKEVVDDGTWYKMSSHTFNSDDTIWFSIHSDGLWERKFIANIAPPGMYQISLKYKFPTFVNDTFLLNRSSFGAGGGANLEKSFIQTLSTNENINVPAGNFSCTYYQSHVQIIDSLTQQIISDDTLSNEFILPSIGMIKSVSFITFLGPNSREETVLLSYSIK